MIILVLIVNEKGIRRVDKYGKIIENVGRTTKKEGEIYNKQKKKDRKRL